MKIGRPKLAIITDGSLPRKVIRRRPLLAVSGVVPFYVTFRDPRAGRFVSRRQTEISVGEFLDIQDQAKGLPQTAQPTSEDFFEEYLRIVEIRERGLLKTAYEEILVLTVPEEKSGTYNSAVNAAELLHERYPNVKVEVFDTGTAAFGVEYLAEMALAARQVGKTLDEIVEELERQRPNIEIVLALDTIAFLDASGRAPGVTDGPRLDAWKKRIRWVALKVATTTARTFHRSPKAVLSFQEGEARAITWNRFFGGAVERVISEVHDRVEGPDRKVQRIYLAHSQAEQEAASALQSIGRFYQGEILERTEIPIALLSITGPKLFAAVLIYKPR